MTTLESASNSGMGKKDDSNKGNNNGPFSAAPKYEQLAKALSFMCHIVQESERAGKGDKHPLDYLKANQIGCEAGIKCKSTLLLRYSDLVYWITFLTYSLVSLHYL